MSQLMTAWSALNPRRRIIVAIVTIAMFAAVLGLSRLATTPSMALLYAGMEPGTAGDVVTALEQQGVSYEVRGESIYVDSARRDEVRMTLAADGLPANTAAGYELLDQLSGFGTTSQMFDAAYWRAREGELARTIVASPHIRAARVHIAAQNSQPFRTNVAPTASVSVTPTSGNLSPQQARAVQHLVAASVSGLRPEDVSVIDATSGLVQSVEDSAPLSQAGEDRASALRSSVERLLEARVGRGNAVVEVTVETETESESITERRFDPDGRVAISSETEERTTSSNETGNGAVTVASNLPDGDAAGGSNSAQNQNSETRETVNYEVSETLREVQRAAGSVRRISVAVLLEGLRLPDESGTVVWAPRPAEEIKALEDLVASAIGFDAARGDVITVRSLEFQPDTVLGTLAEESWLVGTDLMSLVQLAVLALVALALGIFVVRPILISGGTARAGELAGPGGASPALLGAGGASERVETAALTGEIDDGTYDPGSLPTLADRAAPGGDDPVARMRRLIEERRDETVEILRGWMEDRNEEEENV